MMLSDRVIRTAKPQDRRYKLSDGKGLYLQVEPTGSKLWRFKYRFLAKEKVLALGSYPEVTLAAARDRLIDARRLLASGVDPGEQRKQARRAAILASTSTFEAIAREWFAKFKPNWADSHSSKVLIRLDNDLLPWLGSRPISAIEADELLEAIRRVENRGALDTAHRCLGYCSQVFRYAIATSRAKRNPAADLRGALPPAVGGHYASIIDPKAVGELLRAIDGYNGSLVVRCALRLAPLTFVRPGELRSAEWQHIHLDLAEWRIPAEKMKMREDLIVPLCRQAMEILDELKPLTGAGQYLFPSEYNRRRHMSENTVNAALRRMGFDKQEMTGHGFRAMARTLLDEELGYRVDWIEHQLAHSVRDPNGRAYNRTAFLTGRKQMMQGWGDYLDRLRRGDPAHLPATEAA